MALTRTAKSCGSDAPMLASSLREEAQMTVSNKPGHRGEHEGNRKTIARGVPGDFRCDRGDYALVLFLFCMRGCGRIGRPAFPAPSDLRGREIQANLARKPRRDREAVSMLAGCLKFESANAPYCSSSLRTQGPITTGICWSGKPLTTVPKLPGRGVWVPAPVRNCSPGGGAVERVRG